MPKIRLSKGLRKYIRKEKARIRREILDVEEQKKLIDEIYKQFAPKVREEKSQLKDIKGSKELQRTIKDKKTTKKKIVKKIKQRNLSNKT